ncbi:MAG: YceI family protein [Marinicaulis sp.]|nr:YceI family protein [Marinicaulis sp.]NNE41467.1 YceI family protein [Marinicaulis sp.]
MIKKLFIAAMGGVIAACSGEAPAAEQESAAPPSKAGEAWAIDYGASSVTFRGIQEGSEFEGRFNRFDIAVVLDPEDLSGASITATIDMSSVDAGNDDRNQSLPTKDWFKTKEFPSAIFTSSEVSNIEGDNYEAAGTLTIKGISQPMTLPFTLDVEGNVANAVGSVRLNRTDFNVGEGAFAEDKWVGYFVDVTVTVAATSQ